jgi:hypothetical protein
MLFKCNDHLHPLVEYERGVVDQRIDEDNNLHIFKKIANTIGPSMKVINRELLIFKHYQVDVKDIKCPLQ